jgi:hypothetical protein
MKPSNPQRRGPSLAGYQCSRRSFLKSITASAAIPALVVADAQQGGGGSQPASFQDAKGMFPWQFPSKDEEATWRRQSFNIDTWWGDFPHTLPNQMDMFGDNSWAIGPFTKSKYNPVLAPSPQPLTLLHTPDKTCLDFAFAIVTHLRRAGLSEDVIV